MKAVTVHLNEKTYSAFQALARAEQVTTSELIRRAMDEFHQVKMQKRPSLTASPPAASVGSILNRWEGRIDLLDTYLDRS